MAWLDDVVRQPVGALILFILTLVVNYAVVHMSVHYDWDEALPAWAAISTSASVLVSFLISNRVEMATERSQTMVENTEKAISTYFNIVSYFRHFEMSDKTFTEWPYFWEHNTIQHSPNFRRESTADLHKYGKRAIIKSIYGDDEKIHEFIFEDLHKFTITHFSDKTILFDRSAELLDAIDVAKVSYRHATPPEFNNMMVFLLVAFYGIVLPLASVSEFGLHAIEVSALIALFNYYVLYNALSMDKPTRNEIRPNHKTY